MDYLKVQEMYEYKYNKGYSEIDFWMEALMCNDQFLGFYDQWKIFTVIWLPIYHPSRKEGQRFKKKKKCSWIAYLSRNF